MKFLFEKFKIYTYMALGLIFLAMATYTGYLKYSNFQKDSKIKKQSVKIDELNHKFAKAKKTYEKNLKLQKLISTSKVNTQRDYDQALKKHSELKELNQKEIINEKNDNGVIVKFSL